MTYLYCACVKEEVDNDYGGNFKKDFCLILTLYQLLLVFFTLSLQVSSFLHRLEQAVAEFRHFIAILSPFYHHQADFVFRGESGLTSSRRCLARDSAFLTASVYSKLCK